MATHLPVIGGHAEGFGKTYRTDDWWGGPAHHASPCSRRSSSTRRGRRSRATTTSTTPTCRRSTRRCCSPTRAAPGAAPLDMRGSARGRAGGRASRSCRLAGDADPGRSRARSASPVTTTARRTTASFAGSPPGCAVGPLAGKRTYRGETALLLFQNLHRYAMYFALVFIVHPRQGRGRVVLQATASSASASASIILTINVVLIAALHVRLPLVPPPDRRPQGLHVELRQDTTPRSASWKQASWFNARHMQFAWAQPGLGDGHRPLRPPRRRWA